MEAPIHQEGELCVKWLWDINLFGLLGSKKMI